jgi:hypothetical protein
MTELFQQMRVGVHEKRGSSGKVRLQAVARVGKQFSWSPFFLLLFLWGSKEKVRKS